MRNKYLFLIYVVFCLFVSFAFVKQAKAATVVDSDIDQDTVWTKENSPYIVNDFVFVFDEASLTIEPGVTVKFSPDGGLFVLGKLFATGTLNEPVTFTSSLANPGPGSWIGLYLSGSNGGTLVLDNSIIKYAYIIDIFDGQYASITNSKLESVLKGIYIANSQLRLSQVSIEHVNINGEALDVRDASTLTAENLSIKDAGDGLEVYLDSSAKISGFIVDGITNGDVVSVYEDSSVQIDNANLKNISDYGLLVFNNSSVIASKLSMDSTHKEAVSVFNNSTVELTDSVITNAGYWMAMDVSSAGTLKAKNLKLSGGYSGWGDGIVVFAGGFLDLSDSEVSGFTESDGISDGGSLNLPSTIKVQNSLIAQNYNGFGLNTNNSNFSVFNNSITGNTNYGLTYRGTPSINFINNYWGSPTGPFHLIDNPSGTGNSVRYSSGKVNFTPWLSADPLAKITRTPVLIVPGILGTEMYKGDDKLWLDLGHNLSDVNDQFMDPLQFSNDLKPVDTDVRVGDVLRKPSILFDYTQGLIEELKARGYIEGTSSVDSLFLFPYDWRYGATGVFSDGSTNVDLLQKKIQSIMAQTGSDKIDIIAHSTGGLLVKKYVTQHLSNNHIRKAVFVGVPNTGAPKAVKVWLQGDNFSIYWLDDAEMQKMAKNLPVAYDLSPSQKYYTTKGSYIKVIKQGLISTTKQDLDFNESNDFLINERNLNSQALNNAHNLHTAEFDNFDLRSAGVDLFAIDGCKTGTIGKVIERQSKSLLGGTGITYEQPEEVSGDGTVPLESSTNLPIDSSHKFYALKADHGKMPSQDGIRQQIVNIISGGNLSVSGSLITQDIGKCKLKGKAIAIYSPVNIDIVDQDGNHSGLSSDGVSIENNIPNADFEIMGEHKFVFLPTDEGQTYSINLKGTGSGTFTIKNQDITDGLVNQTEIFANLPVTTNLLGNLNLGNSTTLNLDNNGDGTIDQTVQPTSILDAEKSQDYFGPTIAINSPLSNGRYLVGQNVTATYVCEDDLSGIQKCLGNVSNGSSIDTTTYGAKIFTVDATDLAGNNSSLSVNYSVVYRFSNLFAPVSSDSKTFKKNSTIPVKFQLSAYNGNFYGTSVAKLFLDPTEASNGTPAVSGSSGITGNIFKYDPIAQQYVYNLSTSMDLFKPGTSHTLRVIIDGDPAPYDQVNAIKIK